MNLLAVVDASVNKEGLQDLTMQRTVSSVPFAGRYRLIDFPLSNLVNSGVNTVGVFPSNPFSSLLDHIGGGKSWDLDRRKNGLFFLPVTQRNGGLSTVGPFAALEEHMQFFTKSIQPYVVVINSFVVTQLDFKDMLKQHIKSGADITEAVSSGVSLKTYILSKELLIELIQTHRDKKVVSVEDVVNLKKSPYTFNDYEYSGYFAIIDSIQSYFQASLALLDEENRKQLFLPDRPIYTKVKDEPPTRYIHGAHVKRALVANGGTIMGSVMDSIISRGVCIKKNTQLEKCVIMQKCVIEENCDLSYVIADKEVHIGEGVVLRGTAEQPIVLRKGAIVTKEDL
ncbi:MULTISPECIES: sugar phosphate nucleotidyltransferase [Planococcus]|uniref:Glucose-1-phosphate adenylyltransferase n=1 Tax=Planococcus faecalis TaxID=1598147 RepID=A0ABM6INH8_9BACL|nr:MULTISPECIES: sugar phosphate nucleotidyltransferase [Planococcus]AQU78100.1 glucose-1-phosphate adenylyltransferase [Planococcus faecalis]MDJ0331271.1 sugar phosphate nucleotidyltransferase [Planococcus sp. S3-L1]OHX53708.1 glucose-1-phosphate adenylyltransferase [Planococcus faecalis]